MNLPITALPLLFLCIFHPLALPAAGQASVPGRVFKVNHTGDTADISTGDGECRDAAGNCTLRTAIDEANANPDADIIMFTLPEPSIIDLNLGELSITSELQIVGPGARRLMVRRNPAPQTLLFRIFKISARTSIRGMTISNGRIEGPLFGGAFLVERFYRLDLTEVVVRDNFAIYGGGIANFGRVYIGRSLFTGNRGNNLAGAIYNNDNTNPTVRITNSTITGNSAGSHGAISNEGTVILVNTTVTKNPAEMFTSGIANYPEGTVRVLNTILDCDPTPTISCLGGTFTSHGNNIVTDSRNTTGFVNGVNGDQVSINGNLNPMLGPLADNGGQTDTRALLAGSPAINAGGNCVLGFGCPGLPSLILMNDQRLNFTRGSGPVDVGAYEFQPSPLPGSWGFTILQSWSQAHPGAIAKLTDAVTNESRYAAVNIQGSSRFKGLPNSVFILEIRYKRAAMRPVVQVIDFSDWGWLDTARETSEGVTIEIKR